MKIIFSKSAPKQSFAQIWLAMKLTIGLLTFVLLQVSAKGISQTVTYTAKRASLEKIFTAIEKQTPYVFVYRNQDIAKSKLVSIDLRETSIERALEICFIDQPLTYEIINKTIVVSSKPVLKNLLLETIAHSNLEVKPPVTVQGIIKDENGKELPNVSIKNQRTQRGTTSDSKGRFSLEAEANDVLEISYVGYEGKTIKIGINQFSLSVSLNPDVQQLNNLVVTGYGTKSKKAITGSIVSVKAEDLKLLPIANLAQGLQGRVAGLDMRQNSGTPGGNISIRIRGTNSINGNSEPLYVIDGVQISATSAINAANPLSQINPSDIESVEVLKDAAATAIYGARGANGVVLITTKRGKEGITRVSYETYLGLQESTKKMSILNASQFAELENNTFAPTVVFADPKAMGEGTNYLDLIFRKATIQNHQLSITGGNEKTQVALGINYFNQDGIIINSNYKRYALRLNLDHRISSTFKVGTSLYYTVTNEDRVNAGGTGVNVTSARGGILGRAVAAPPILLPYRADGSVYSFADQFNSRYRETNNPMGDLAIKNFTAGNRFIANVYLDINILKGLTYRASFNTDLGSELQEFYSPRSIVDSNSLANPSAINGSASNNSTYTTTLLHESILTYKTIFGFDHSLNITAVYATQTDKMQQNNQTGSGFGNDFTMNYAAQNANIYAISSFRNKSDLDSYLGRISYGFRDKYFLEATARVDGSSKFGENNKYGFFPAISGAWRIIKEKFMEPVHFISDLKLRASYGKTGNAAAIGPYQSLSTVTGLGFDYNFNNSNRVGINPTNIANPNLKWEEARQFNIGLDFSFFNNRINAVIDYYNKRTDNLLFSKSIPMSSGYTSITGNYGSIENKGIEFGVNAKILTGKLKWDVSGNITFNKNKVLALDGVQSEIATSSYSILKIGEPLGVFRVFALDGINQTGEAFLPGYDSRTGGFKIKDVNGDGRINNSDLILAGNAQPKYFFGFSTTLKFMNFDLGAFLQGVQGSSLFNAFRFTFETPSGQVNLLSGVENRWSASNPSNEYVKPQQGTNLPVGNRWVENNSYIRLRNLSLGYTFPKYKFIQGIRAYISANNLFTITKYQGWDPESNSFGSSNALFYDNGTYPAAKSYLVGIQCNF